MEIVGNVLRLFGLAVAIVGLWNVATGLRVVVSGRIDERRRSFNSLKWGLPLIAIGILLWIAAAWLSNRAQLA